MKKNKSKKRDVIKNKKKKKVLLVVDILLLLAIALTVYLCWDRIKPAIDRLGSKAGEAMVGGNIDTDIHIDVPDDTDTKRLTGSYNILFIGKDDVALNTDVMMLINISTVKNKISVMQIPRDTFFTFNNQPVKINSLMARLYNYTGDDENDKKNAIIELKKVLSQNLAINIDHCAMIDLQGVAAIVDMIGGVDMYVPYDMKYVDHTQDLYINLKEGQQTLSGAQAVQFLRFRSGYLQADMGRQDAQKMFLVAFLNKFRGERGSKYNLTDLLKEVEDKKYLISTFDSNDAAGFALIVRDIITDLGNLSLFSAPGQPYSMPIAKDKSISYFVINREATYKLINEHYNLLNVDIPEESFDRDRNFTLLTSSDINSIYNRHLDDVTVYNGDTVDKDGIDILLR